MRPGGLLAIAISLVALGGGDIIAGGESLRIIDDLNRPDAVAGWYAVDDRVMGGVSRSRVEAVARGVRFAGDVSLDRGGGFASVRRDVDGLDLSDCDAIVLRTRGDGKRYKLSLRTDQRFDGVVYQVSFIAPPGEWRDVVLPLASFRASWRGRAVPEAPPLDASRIVSLGLLISDRQAGSFALDIDWIGASLRE